MKHLIATLAILPLVILQSCSSGHHGNDHRNHSSMSDPHAGYDGGHGGGHETATSTATLQLPGAIAPQTPTPLAIDITDQQGKAIAQFDTFQEKLMHLIVVSNNLQIFDHIHPNYQQNGRFEVSATFPQAGNYTLFSDYKPAGQTEQVAVLNVAVPGASASPAAINLERSKTIDDLTVNLTPSPLKAGEDVLLTFDIQRGNQPITSLQPYLGEQGHLVIIRQADVLTRSDYIHAHAQSDTPAHQIRFHTTFPQSGNYKLWGQFNDNGKIVVADFWVNVP